MAQNAKESHQGRFGGRYQLRKSGTGHQLSAAETKSLLIEQLSDFVKPGYNTKARAANVYFTEAHDPPDEIVQRMVAAVAPEHRTPHMLTIFQTMLRVYVKGQWGVDLTNGSGDC